MDDELRKTWESLRKCLARVRHLLGGGRVYLGNDLLGFNKPSEEEAFKQEFYLPPEVSEALLREPDAERRPELEKVPELRLLRW